MYAWSPQNIRAAIERCNQDCIAAIERHEKPEIIEQKRRGIETLTRWLRKAEAKEHGRMGVGDGHVGG